MQPATIRVLLVDDDEEEFLILKAHLGRAEGGLYLVDWAPGLQEALPRLAGGEHDACLLDWNLGPASGREILDRFPGNTRSFPIIVLTGESDPAADHDALRAGADDYLVKGQADCAVLDRAIRYAIERRKAEARLLAANQRLEEGETVKRTLVSRVSHELRTPLASIRGALALASAGLLAPPELADMLQLAERNAARLSDLVNDLLELDRLSNGPDLHLASCRLDELFRQAVESVDLYARQNGVQLRISPAGGICVQGDMRRLVQVLINLLGNAVKFSEPGQVVDLSWKAEGDKVEVRVRDEGPGIPPDKQASVFEPFYQVEGPSAKGGTGLGLAICKKIIEQHGGSLGIESRPGQGATFWFKLATPRPA